jgi:hypothetical protein
MASKESFEMMMIPKWLDAGHIPIENRAGAEEIPMEASIGRSYGKSRAIPPGEWIIEISPGFIIIELPEGARRAPHYRTAWHILR